MKTRTLRNAISIALLVAAIGTGEWAMAQNTTTDTATQGRAPVTKAPAKTQPKKATDTASPPAVTNLQTMTVTGTRIRGGSTPSPVITIGSEQIQQEIPHSELAVFEEGSHMTFWEEPERYLAVVDDFLRRT